MAKIDLGREQGAVVTGSAQHGATSPAGYGQLAGGYERLNRARESISRSVAYASDVFMKAFNDLAETRNRQEILEGRTQLFDITNQANTALEERIDSGEFDKPNGLALFKQAARASHLKVEKDFNDWSAQNVTQISTRNALNEDAKLDFKRNFAHLSGVFLAHDRKRRWDMFQNQADNAITSGNIDNLKAAYHAFVGGGKDRDGNSLPYFKSEDFCKKLWEELDYKFCAQRISDAKNKIAAATTPEAVFEIIDKLQSNDSYFGVYENDRAAFDIFVCHRLDQMENARETAAEKEARNLEKLRKKNEEAANNEISGIKVDASKAFKICYEKGQDVSKNVGIDEERKKIENILNESGISPAKKKAALADFDKWCDSEQERIRKQVETIMQKQAIDALKIAVEENEADIDAMRLAGGDKKTAESIQEARKINERMSQANEVLADKISNGRLSGEEEKDAFEYRKTYFGALSSILKYDKEMDPRGEKLAKLIVDSQKFDAKSRKDFLRALYNKVVKNTETPAKWDAADIKQFDEDFSKLCEYNKDTFDWWRYDDTNNPVLYSRMYSRVLKWAKMRDMSPAEAKAEMEKDPFFVKILTKRSMSAAIEFLDEEYE